MDPRWRLDGDALDAVGVRLALQRICASHWHARGVLRSWGLAPLHRDGDTLCVPCGDGEALWIGAWPEPPGGCGVVVLRDADTADDVDDAQGTRIEVPRESAITALGGDRPIARQPGQRQRALSLRVTGLGGEPVAIALVLLAPADWSARSGRPWAALSGPPPRPPRLG